MPFRATRMKFTALPAQISNTARQDHTAGTKPTLASPASNAQGSAFLPHNSAFRFSSPSDRITCAALKIRGLPGPNSAAKLMRSFSVQILTIIFNPLSPNHLTPISPPSSPPKFGAPHAILNLKRPLADIPRSGLFYFNRTQRENTAMMAPRSFETNRTHEKSSGPVTQAGKDTVSRNALVHGLASSRLSISSPANSAKRSPP
jgi:hypothetical protein